MRFQFLLGTLITKFAFLLSSWRVWVSIPLRYADNSGNDAQADLLQEVSIPLRYADNPGDEDEAVAEFMFQFLLGTLITSMVI